MRTSRTGSAAITVLGCIVLSGTNCPTGVDLTTPEIPASTTTNQKLTANAGTDINAGIGQTVALDASGSTDPEGNALSFLWEQLSGQDVQLTGVTEIRVTFVVPGAGTFEFQVTVTDQNGATATASVRVMVPYDTTTLSHWGFDFSKKLGGTETDDVADSDGDMIGWAPLPTTAGDLGEEIWWRCRSNTATENFTKDMGEVALSSVTVVPTGWDAGKDEPLDALKVNHVYVVKCLDGFAKFLVRSLSTVGGSWEAEVEFAFTSTTTFDY